MPGSFSISDLASEFDVTTRTIRFYEEKGLLNPKREGTRRVYSSGGPHQVAPDPAGKTARTAPGRERRNHPDVRYSREIIAGNWNP